MGMFFNVGEEFRWLCYGVAAVVRRRIKKCYWVFCGFTLGGKVLGRLKYLCLIPDMSSELFRALTSAATRRWCVGG